MEQELAAQKEKIDALLNAPLDDTAFLGSMINVVETHYVSCNIYFFVRKEVRSE